jgi:hypothetical protein
VPRDNTTNDSSVEAKPAQAMALFDHGYTHLIPILPPDARDENGDPLKGDGKAPGQKIGEAWDYLSGWQKRGAATREDVEGHLSDGANIGHVLGDLIALDIDDDDPERQAAVLAIIADDLESALADLTVRFNTRPMVLARRADGSPPITKRSIDIIDEVSGEPIAKFEVLGEGQQAVVAGTNAAHRAIRISNLVLFADLPEVSPEQTDELCDAIGRYYRDQGFTVCHGGGGGGDSGPPPEQEGLQAPDGARSVLDLMTDGAGTITIPNTIASRYTWLAVAAAMKASCRSPDDWASLEQVFVDWTMVRHPNDRPEDILKQWHSLHSPFRNGWTFLQDTLDRAGLAARVFSPVDGFDPGESDIAHSPPASSRRVLKIVHYGDTDDSDPPRQLVQNTLTEGGLSLVLGKPSSGKSFVALDMCGHIASGTPWFDRGVEQTGVVIFALEGGGSFHLRVDALKSKFAGDLPLSFVPESVNFLSSPEDLAAAVDAVAVEAAHHGIDIGLVVIDTLARAMPGGDENGPQDMTAVIRNMDRLRASTGAHVMLVHHLGKDASRGARGHSSLLGAVDTELTLTKEHGDHNGEMKVTKQKDLEPWHEPVPYVLKQISFGLHDQWGEPRTSCTVEPAPTIDFSLHPPEAKLSPRDRALLDLCESLTVAESTGASAAENDGNTPEKPDKTFKAGLYAICPEKVLKQAPGKTRTERDNQRRMIRRSFKVLKDNGLIDENGRTGQPDKSRTKPDSPDPARRAGQDKPDCPPIGAAALSAAAPGTKEEIKRPSKEPEKAAAGGELDLLL